MSFGSLNGFESALEIEKGFTERLSATVQNWLAAQLVQSGAAHLTWPA
jgi:hypothetical protein